MAAPTYVYAGSLTEWHGLRVIQAEPCDCPACPADYFTCPTCGPWVEYSWIECPHDPPPPRFTVWLERRGAAPVRLVHVRARSLRQVTYARTNPAWSHHSGSCSP